MTVSKAHSKTCKNKKQIIRISFLIIEGTRETLFCSTNNVIDCINRVSLVLEHHGWNAPLHAAVYLSDRPAELAATSWVLVADTPGTTGNYPVEDTLLSATGTHQVHRGDQSWADNPSEEEAGHSGYCGYVSIYMVYGVCFGYACRQLVTRLCC